MKTMTMLKLMSMMMTVVLLMEMRSVLADKAPKPEVEARGEQELAGDGHGGGDGEYGDGIIAAVVVLCFNRPAYLERSLRSVRERWLVDFRTCLERRRELFLRTYDESERNRFDDEEDETVCKSRFPVFVSQDGDHRGVARVVNSFCSEEENAKSDDDDGAAAGDAATKNAFGCFHVHWPRPVDEKGGESKKRGTFEVYRNISTHYRNVLTELFDGWGFRKVLVLEDDMELSVDFFEYFEAMAALLDEDEKETAAHVSSSGTNEEAPGLLCASSWNDNGKGTHVSDPAALLRSDFFPGLGWMLTSAVWRTLAPEWPEAYWDDWMRSDAVRRGTGLVVNERKFLRRDAGDDHEHVLRIPARLMLVL